MDLIRAIITVVRLKNGSLNVKKHGSFYSWNWQTDTDWISYSNARYCISKYKIINRVLKILSLL